MQRVQALLIATGVAIAPTAFAEQCPDQGSNPTTTQDERSETIRQPPARLGVQVMEVNPELRTFLGAPKDRGVRASQRPRRRLWGGPPLGRRPPGGGPHPTSLARSAPGRGPRP